MFPSRWPMYEKRFIIYKRKVSHLNKRVLPARRMVLHLKKESISYPEGCFFIPIRKVIQSSISWIPLIQSTKRKNERQLRDGFCLHFFQATRAKNFDLLRVIAVNGTMNHWILRGILSKWTKFQPTRTYFTMVLRQKSVLQY